MAITYDPTTADPGTIEKIPAGDLIIDPNVRTSVRLDKSFVSSIRVLGFQQTPTGYRDEDGKIHITVGQRRISAALEIGWPVIPVVIKPRRDAEHDKTEELRLLEQIAENEQRLGLTPAELAGGYKELALLGVSEDQIARKTNTGKTTIRTALTVTESTAALAAVTAHQITLEQAAIIAEFEGDEQAVAELNETAATSPAQLQHTAERIRNRHLDEEVIARLTEKAQKAGAEVVDSIRGAGGAPIGELWPVGDDGRARLTLSDVRKGNYTGFVAKVERGWGSPTGKNRGYQIVWGLTGWKDQGLTTYGDRAPIDDAEKARRRQKRIDKAEMIAATEVRRAWLRDELLNPARKTYPDTAMAWVARDLWHGDGALRHSYDHGLGFTLEHLLGITEKVGVLEGRNLDTGEWRYSQKAQVEQLLDDARDPFRLALAIAIGHTEQIVGDPKTDDFGQGTRHAAYLRQLTEWGYTLSDVEQRIIATADANHVRYQAKADAA